jgi:hypothetical protein
MSLIKKIDVDKHLAARRAMRLGRMPLMWPPGAARTKPAVPQKKAPAFKQDFVLEHSSLEHSSLEHASLEHASLEHASLEHASLEHSAPNVLGASFAIASDAGRSRLLRPPRSRQV